MFCSVVAGKKLDVFFSARKAVDVRWEVVGTQYAKIYPNRKAYIRRKLLLIHWAQKIAQTPEYGFVGKITTRPSIFKTRK